MQLAAHNFGRVTNPSRHGKGRDVHQIISILVPRLDVLRWEWLIPVDLDIPQNLNIFAMMGTGASHRRVSKIQAISENILRFVTAPFSVGKLT